MQYHPDELFPIPPGFSELKALDCSLVKEGGKVTGPLGCVFLSLSTLELLSVAFEGVVWHPMGIQNSWQTSCSRCLIRGDHARLKSLGAVPSRSLISIL